MSKPVVIKLGKITRSGKRTKLALKSDRRLTALGPGKRRSKNGKIYYEYRVNHADAPDIKQTKQRQKNKSVTSTKIKPVAESKKENKPSNNINELIKDFLAERFSKHNERNATALLIDKITHGNQEQANILVMNEYADKQIPFKLLLRK